MKQPLFTFLLIVAAATPSRLYQLPPELYELTVQAYGSLECEVPYCSTDIKKELTDDVNKALVIDYTASNRSDIVRAFTNPTVERLNHLVVDKNTGHVYIGAVNRLYQLSPELDIIIVEVTGPEYDSYDCEMAHCSTDAKKELIDDVNKALVIDYTASKLISCGSLFQGICSVRNLYNISDGVQKVMEAVVANDATSSTVAFIAPGPLNPPDHQVMYVGVTFTPNSAYRSEIPAVCSRSLEKDRMFQIAHRAVTTGTHLFVHSLARDRYPITYVYGFSSEKFSYFLTTQKRDTIHQSSQFITKLVRVCQEDENYYSYTEIPMDCTSEAQGGRKYNLVQAAYVGKAGSDLAVDLGITTHDDVLFAVFSESDSEEVNKPSNFSALCVYSLKAIRRKFLQNIKICFSGIGDTGLDFVSPSDQCVPTKIQVITEDFCGVDINTPLEGKQPISAVPVLLFNTRLTSVAATSIYDFTVVFIGTATGHLKKVVIESATSAFEFGDLTIEEGSAVNPDLHFDSQLKHLYVMTERKVFKVKVQECSGFTTCWDCLRASDPYCGWCSLESKCTLQSNCQDATRDPLYWVSYKSGKCAAITYVIPNQLHSTTTKTLNLVVDNLPNLSDQYLCAFTALDKILITNATRTNNYVINCPTPPIDLLPSIPIGQHDFTAKLSVRTASGYDLASTNFTFFNCNTYSLCTQCVSSSFPCDWCIGGHRCTHDTAENCKNDILIKGSNNVGLSFRKGPSFCPTISSMVVGLSPEILVASGSKKSITVKVHTAGQIIAQSRCQFNIEGRAISVKAQILEEAVYCDSMDFTYTSKLPNITVNFAVIWGYSVPLDNVDNIHVVIYRCDNMANHCGMCLTLEEKYKCGWCQSSDSCEVKEQCGNGSAVWLNRSRTCPNPEITSFSPELGPWEGGTNITIKGINLGKAFQEIYSGVSIAGISCQPYEQLYIATKEIVCKVNGSNKPHQGSVVVRVEDYRGESKFNYSFVDPIITRISPKYGPQSGGTVLRINGEYMNAGSNIQAFITNLPCKILSTAQKEVLCLTSASDLPISGDVRMKFDDRDRLFDDNFHYVKDPTIESVESGMDSQIKVPKGIPAGGILISVSGKNLAYIQNPQMYVYYEQKIFFGQCSAQSNTKMTCNSPKIESDESKLHADNPLKLEYGFKMDNVSGVLNLTTKNGFPHFLLYPSPNFERSDKEIRYYKSDYLNINVSKVTVQECNNVNKTCGDCIGANDPYCESCSLENSFQFFKCGSGECISKENLCDGTVECADESDEQDDCKNKVVCPFSFQCNYGACIANSKKCNGKRDCRDHSDEIFPECTIKKPVVNECGITEFRCDSGHCIDDSKFCNGMPDCLDASDEQSCLQILKPQPTAVTTQGCRMPNNPLHGEYSLINYLSVKYKPGDIVPIFSLLSVNCKRGYKAYPLSEDNNPSYCLYSGQWTPTPKTCARSCPPLMSTKSTIVKCKFNGIFLDTCLNPIENTTAQISCESLHEDQGLQHNPTRLCKDGSWDYPISNCYPVCGEKRAQGKTNIVNGNNVILGDYPWQVGVYNVGKDHICGGSIINQGIVLSAAHCFTDHYGHTYPTENYLIAAGKYYRSYNDERDINAQYSDVDAIHVPERYKAITNFYEADIAIIILSTPFQLSNNVQPVCIDLQTQYDEPYFSTNGIVTGWGYINEQEIPSEVLKELYVPFIPYHRCFEEVPKPFRRFITYDKICGGYLDNATSVCGGDSGGALVFPKINGFIERYYVRGIVSTSPSTAERTCDSNQYGTYTSVAKHVDFIRDLVTLNRVT